jgi:ATP-binding cassette subfamily C (CFTR/MRP) protein 1
MYLLYLQLGISLFAGVGTITSIVILNFIISKRIQKTSKLMLKEKDNRNDLVDEMLKNYKMIKFFSWEKL